ncbi:MAG: polysaccharide biosynthesis/export family protein, partial [Nitrospinota bacterium]
MRRFGTARKKFPLLSVFVTLCFVFPNVSQNVANAQPDETMVPFPKRFAPVRSLVKKKPKEEEEKRKGRPEKRGSAQEAGTKKKFKPKPFGRFEKKRLTSPKSFSASGAAVGGGRTTAENPDFTVYPDSIPEYLIGHEDVLEISVWKNSELSKTVMVRPDGMVSLPLIGDVLAAGRTPDELRQVITQRLQEYQENVIVSV